MKRCLAFFLFSVLFSFMVQPIESVETYIKRDWITDDIVGERPDETAPTNVKVGLKIKDISVIDDAAQTFDADITVVLMWDDPRLSKDTKEVRKVPLTEIWHPLVKVVNARSLTHEADDTAYVTPEGHVIYMKNLRGSFTIPLDLKNFPFDVHDLEFKLRSYYGSDEIKFQIDEDTTTREKKFSIPNWVVSKGKAKVESSYYDIQNLELAAVEVSFELKRLMGFYFWKMILPMTLIVLMSWGVFWIPPAKLAAQLALSATAFLTLIAFQLAIGNQLPHIAYLSRLDRFIIGCQILVFLSIIEAITTTFLARMMRLQMALKIDFVSRFIFPIAFACVIYFSFFF